MLSFFVLKFYTSMKKYLYLRFMFICLQMWTSVSPVHVKMAPFVKIL